MQFKNLERFRTGGSAAKMQLGIPVPKTPKQRVYRFSPNETAHPRHFVLGDVNASASTTDVARARMKLEPHSKQTVCPYSGAVAANEDFTHPDDVKAAVEVVKDAAIRDAQEAISKMLRGLEGRSRGGLITVKTSSGSRHRPKPRFTRRDLMRELVCDHCGRDYGVFAIGLFCPDCGAPNLRLHFAREAELVGAQVDIAETLGDEAGELAYRLLGNAHEDVLTAFEATLKTVYLYGTEQRPPGSLPFRPVKNDFQNIERGRTRFAELAFDPFDALSDDELAVLSLNIQKRHVIGHNLGIVDEQFAGKANDARIGETVHLVGEDIRTFAAISQKVVDRLDGWLCGSPSPFIGLEQEALVPTQEQPSDIDTQLAALDLELSFPARRLALWVARQCSDGMGEFVDNTKLKEAFEDVEDTVLVEAIAELETDGFVSVSRSIGEDLPFFRPTNDLYLTFDAIAFEHDPVADAVKLAELSLAEGESVDVSKLHSLTGWSHRRFNPALAVVLDRIDDRHVSRELGSEYPTRWFHIEPQDRVSLKRFLQKMT